MPPYIKHLDEMIKRFGYFKKEDACTLLVPLEGEHAQRYQHFRDLLKNNYIALHRAADIEEAYYGGRPFTLQWVKSKYRRLVSSCSGDRRK
jgi:hypothetical protein